MVGQNNMHVFWEALIITVFIFGIGIMIGISFENSRVSSISSLYENSEINLLDLRIQAELFDLDSADCSSLVKANAEFGDKIFEEAILLQQLEESQTLTDSLKQEHRKYDLLRTYFWVNSIKVKQQCPGLLHTIVYLYQYDSNIGATAQQNAFSNYLSELKQSQGTSIVLIPIAGNMNLTSTEFLIKKYNITSLPVVIIDEKDKIYTVEDLKKIPGLL